MRRGWYVRGDMSPQRSVTLSPQTFLNVPRSLLAEARGQNASARTNSSVHRFQPRGSHAEMWQFAEPTASKGICGARRRSATQTSPTPAKLCRSSPSRSAELLMLSIIAGARAPRSPLNNVFNPLCKIDMPNQTSSLCKGSMSNATYSTRIVAARHHFNVS